MSEQPAGELPEFTRIGPYRLLQQLGEGGMGVVHLALDRAGRAVAIKVLRPHVAADPAARTRLAREVDTLSRIRHPNVAPIIDHDVEGERPYIVTRYIAGPGLDEVVDDAGPLRGAALLQVGRGLAGALHAIHEAGVIHRDVKPGNILLLDGEPILIDFGIAHVADDVRLTRTGLVMGTPGYLSPEIVEGAAVTDSTDWWGWAATLGFAAQGRPPFGRGSMETILSRVVRGEADLAGVDPDLVPLLEAALSPYPEDRPTDTEVLRALERYAAGGQVTDVLRVVTRREAPGTSAAATPVTELLSGPATAVLPPVAPPPPRVVAPAPAPAREPAAQPSYAGGTAYDRGTAYAGGTAYDGSPQPRPAYTRAPAYDPRDDPRAHAAAPAAPPGRSDTPGRPAPWAAPGGPEPAWRNPGPDERPTLAGASALTPSSWEGDPQPEGQGAAYPQRPLPPRPAMAGDPRIGRASRGGVLLALGAALVAGAAGHPALALVVGLGWSVLARTADRSVTSLVLRRHHKGERPSDLAMSVLSSPVHLLIGLVATLAGALIPLAVGLAGVFATVLAARMADVAGPERLTYAVALAVGMALAVMMSWWGPGGAGLRRGSRSLARGLAPGDVFAQGVTGVLLAAATGLAVWAGMSADLPLWWPLTGAPDILQSLTTAP